MKLLRTDLLGRVKANLQNRLSRIEKVLQEIVEKDERSAQNESERIGQNVNSGFMPSTQQQNHFSRDIDSEFQLTSNAQLSEDSSQNQLSTEPIRSLYEVTKRQSFQRDSDAETRNSPVPANTDGDIITKGIISGQEAQELFD